MVKLDISEMQRLQRVLQEKYKDIWAEITPEEFEEAYLKKHERNLNRW